jgi:hypothetical protein
MTKSPTRESPPQASKQRHRAVGMFTITAANTSSPLRNIGPRHRRTRLSSTARPPGPLLTRQL